MSQPDDAAAKRNKLVEARLAVEHTRERLARARRCRRGSCEAQRLRELAQLRYSSAAITGYMRGLANAKE